MYELWSWYLHTSTYIYHMFSVDAILCVYNRYCVYIYMQYIIHIIIHTIYILYYIYYTYISYIYIYYTYIYYTYIYNTYIHIYIYIIHLYYTSMLYIYIYYTYYIYIYSQKICFLTTCDARPKWAFSKRAGPTSAKGRISPAKNVNLDTKGKQKTGWWFQPLWKY